MENSWAYIQEKIKSERKQQGLSQTDLADMVGWKQSQISALENGGTCSTEMIFHILNALDCVMKIERE